MKSITLHNIDDSLYEKISELASKNATSLNKTIQALLINTLGLVRKKTTDHSSDFKEFLGVWTQTDQSEFQHAIKDLEKIDRSDWQ